MKPILIYQPGKVGSMTVYNKIKALDIEVLHLHTIDIDNSHKLPTQLNKQKRLSCKLYHQITRSRNWDLITIVREPLARAVSAHYSFHNNANHFTTDHDHDALHQWYDRQLQKYLRVDT